MSSKLRFAIGLGAVIVAVVFFAVARGGGGSSGAAIDNQTPTTASAAGSTSAPASAGASQTTLGAAAASPTTASRPTIGQPTTGRASTTQALTVETPVGMKSVAVGSLPPEARTTLKLIDSAGPFPYRQDGVVFENREQHLLKEPSGYYHEYTVVTPGSPDRGTRRIITGSNGERFYTDDHYATFRLVTGR